MQNITAQDGPTTDIEYRERLSPSLWVLVSAAVCAPMAALVFAPIDTTLSLVAGVVVGVAIVALMVAGSPVITVAGGRLRAGRAQIDVRYLGEASALMADEARHARGSGLDARAWHLIRGGVDSVAVFAITDDDDPAPTWVISSRTPDRLIAAVRRAQLTQRTPGR